MGWGVFDESSEGPPGTFESGRQHVIPATRFHLPVRPHVAHLGCECGYRVADDNSKLVVHKDRDDWERET